MVRKRVTIGRSDQGGASLGSPRTIGAFATIKSMLHTNASTRGSIHDASENRTIPPTGHGGSVSGRGAS